MRRAVRVATELDNPMTVGYVRAFEGILAALEPEGHDLDAAAAAADTVTSTMRIDYFAMVAELLCGWRDVRASGPWGSWVGLVDSGTTSSPYDENRCCRWHASHRLSTPPAVANANQ